MCLYPKLIENKKYKANKKNGGVIPAVVDKRVLYVPVGCGNCIECRKQKARQWQVRMMEEIRHDKSGKFVTLTFNNESLQQLNNEIKGLTGYERENEIATIAIRRYLERWRKKHKKSVKHWFVTELGQTNTERIHIHGIIWTDETESIKEQWKYGNIYIGDYVNESTINYIVKYLNKADEKHKYYKSKIMTSAGIGKGYMEREQSGYNKYNEKTDETYRLRNGQKIALPIYYRNKIYTEEEREKLWCEKLDKQERWVMGTKVKVSSIKEEEDYYKILKEAQEKNKRIGYGDDTIDWEKKRYENEKRNINKLAKVMKKK